MTPMSFLGGGLLSPVPALQSCAAHGLGLWRISVAGRGAPSALWWFLSSPRIKVYLWTSFFF